MENIYIDNDLRNTDSGMRFIPIYENIGSVTGSQIKQLKNGNGMAANSLKRIEDLVNETLLRSCCTVSTGLNMTSPDDIAQQLFGISFTAEEPFNLLPIYLVNLEYEKKFSYILKGNILRNTINEFNKFMFYNTAKIICMDCEDDAVLIIKLLICPYDRLTKRAVVNDEYELVDTCKIFLEKHYNTQFWNMFMVQNQ